MSEEQGTYTAAPSPSSPPKSNTGIKVTVGVLLVAVVGVVTWFNGGKYHALGLYYHVDYKAVECLDAWRGHINDPNSAYPVSSFGGGTTDSKAVYVVAQIKNDFGGLGPRLITCPLDVFGKVDALETEIELTEGQLKVEPVPTMPQ